MVILNCYVITGDCEIKSDDNISKEVKYDIKTYAKSQMVELGFILIR